MGTSTCLWARPVRLRARPARAGAVGFAGKVSQGPAPVAPASPLWGSAGQRWGQVWGTVPPLQICCIVSGRPAGHLVILCISSPVGDSMGQKSSECCVQGPHRATHALVQGPDLLPVLLSSSWGDLLGPSLPATCSRPLVLSSPRGNGRSRRMLPLAIGARSWPGTLFVRLRLGLVPCPSMPFSTPATPCSCSSAWRNSTWPVEDTRAAAARSVHVCPLPAPHLAVSSWESGTMGDLYLMLQMGDTR